MIVFVYIIGVVLFSIIIGCMLIWQHDDTQYKIKLDEIDLFFMCLVALGILVWPITICIVVPLLIIWLICYMNNVIVDKRNRKQKEEKKTKE